MSEKNKELRKPLYDWSFMVNPNPPAGVRENDVEVFP